MHSWHALGVKQIFSELQSNQVGLGENAAQDRLKQYGPNELSVKRTSLFRTIIEPFTSAFVLVLLAAAVISVFSHEVLDAVIIGTVIVINAAIFYIQSYMTSRVLRSLKKHSQQTVQVIRDGASQEIDSKYLVPGDVMVVGEGQRIPADGRVFESDGLQLDESSLTGESLPVAKNSATLAPNKAVFERHNMLYQGTYVLSGAGKAIVVATGLKTEFGRVAQLAGKNEEKSPVQQKIDGIITKLIKALAIASVFIFSLAMYRGMETSEAIRFVLALAVSVVPEGLPVALTAIIVLGMRRMAKKNALVRSFKAIEDIGQVTIVATDKTGTLTLNKLRVVDHWTIDGKDIKPILSKTIAGDSDSGDPLDVAIAEFASEDKSPLQIYPFEQSIRMSGSAWDESKKVTIYLKGAPEHILNLSDISDDKRHQAESRLREFASNGYRVIGVAKLSLKEAPKNLKSLGRAKLHFVGFVALADELRPESYLAVKDTLKAGIGIRLITGDHYETAFHIAKKLGIASHPSQVVSGIDLPATEDELAKLVKEKTVFARISPEDKFRILAALKRTEITAMTGDGVNDVPALTNAHVGVAMGSGSDIARDAGDIVLLDNNFASIIKAIGEGRVIYDNIRRMLFYLLTTNLGIVLTIVGALVMGMPLPLTAIQILWINLVTDTAMVLPLGLELPESDYMSQKPRRPKEPILSRLLVNRMLLTSAVMAAVTLIVIKALSDRNFTQEQIQTVAFMTLIAAQWMNAFNARSEKDSLLKRLRHPNHGLTLGLGIAVGLQLMAMVGPLRPMLGIESVAGFTIVLATTGSIMAVFAIAEIHKFWSKKYI